MASVAYNIGLIHWNNWEETSTPQYAVKCALVGTSYAPVKTHSSMDDVTGEALDSSATPSYFRQLVSNRVETVDNVANLIKYDADDVVFPQLLTDDPVSGAVLYIEDSIDPGNDSLSILLAYCDFDTTNTNGTDLTVVWPSAGVARLRQAI